VRRAPRWPLSNPPELPCRFRIRLDGFEWFIYNKTPAFDWLYKILDRMVVNGDEMNEHAARTSSAQFP
jgi:hypothetical protein